ncbi:hypothetical protein MJI69_29175, partial [Salmonella enterica subsp. enterica serovar Anatum]|nr:hypothetical protein [Salmonella enterica subsp. enterica serovar Anatum]
LICSVLGCAFCFIALMGASSFELSGTFIVSLIILMFYGRKMHMGNKYSGLQIGIHWLVFFLVIVAYAAMELRGFAPRSYRPWFN